MKPPRPCCSVEERRAPRAALQAELTQAFLQLKTPPCSVGTSNVNLSQLANQSDLDVFVGLATSEYLDLSYTLHSRILGF